MQTVHQELSLIIIPSITIYKRRVHNAVDESSATTTANNNTSSTFLLLKRIPHIKSLKQRSQQQTAQQS